MNSYGKSLKEIRELRRLSQDELLAGKNRATVSRLESGHTDIKLPTLEVICDSLGITVSEFVSLSDSKNQMNKLLILYRECTHDLTNLELKENFLNHFSQLNLKKDDELTRIEYNFKYSVRSVFSTYWKEIQPLTDKDVKKLYKHLLNSDFFGQYDYMLALNIAKHFTSKQMQSVIDSMYPLKEQSSRNDLTKQYADLLVTNAISRFIYNKEYDIAFNYIGIAQNYISISHSYYLHLNLLYLKNLVLSLQHNDSRYIDKAREVIRIIHDIGDIATAKTFEDELNNLIFIPDYYTKTNTVAETPAST